MSDYELTWVTGNLAVGYAPMSHADLESIKVEGINGIVNLCAEFCDLHEIEEESGFEVYYLPIQDETAPDMEAMEKALEWLDEAIFLGKKILVHCRFGVGRTGTFVTSYLLRKGLGLKMASRKLKKTRANPTNFSQWRLLKKYSKKSGVLKIREPSLETKNVVDLGAYFAEYEAVIRKVTEDIQAARKQAPEFLSCGDETDSCCFGYFEVPLIEAIYLNTSMNRTLKSDLRKLVIHDAAELGKQIKRIRDRLSEKRAGEDSSGQELADEYVLQGFRCPLNHDRRCLLNYFRPLRCRIYGLPNGPIDPGLINDTLQTLSRNIFLSLSGYFLDEGELSFPLADIVSGRFIQEYFYCLVNKDRLKKPAER